MRFRDRKDAGRQLAERLSSLRSENPIVLALPRGGVEVGYEVARALGAPLDVIVARKLGAPFQPELGIGAVAPEGVLILDEHAIRVLGVSRTEIERIVEEETEEMERRLRHFRGDRRMPDLTDRTVLLVDDGLATGVTARAALRAIRRWTPRRIVLAAPVCAPETARALSSEADEVVCLCEPLDFGAVGLWYDRFDQTSDEEVLDLLERSRREWSSSSDEDQAGAKHACSELNDAKRIEAKRAAAIRTHANRTVE